MMKDSMEHTEKVHRFHISNNIDNVMDKIFTTNKWRLKMEKLGLAILFYGIDIMRLDSEAPIHESKGSAYIAMGLATKTDPCLWPTQFSHGYPLLRLFFQCLRPWKWSREGKHSILILDSNIELNIGDYALSGTIGATPADLRLLRNPEQIGQTESAMCCGAPDADGAFDCFHFGQQIIFVTRLWGATGMRTFYQARDDCTCEVEEKLKDVTGFAGPAGEYEEIEDIRCLPLLQHELMDEDTRPETHSQIPTAVGKAIINDLVPINRHVPTEIQQLITENLDPATLVPAARAGLALNTRTLRHAQHLNFWKTLLQGQHSAMKSLTHNRGDIFAMGIGASYLYNGLFELPRAAPSPLPIILSWTSSTGIQVNPHRFNYSDEATILYPFIRLHASPPTQDRKIVVNDLGHYIKKRDVGVLVIPILYFRDTEWKLHTTKVQFEPDNHQYSFKVKNKNFVLTSGASSEIPWHLQDEG